MFAVALILLALVGGSTVTYFLMDAPRRRAERRLRDLRRDEIDLDLDREELDERGRRIDDRARQLAAAIAATDRRNAELSQREGEFGRRVISYDELVTQNQFLTSELRNTLLHTSFLEQQQHANQSGTSTVTEQRDRLGRAYFDEVLSTACRQITPTNFTTMTRRIDDVAAVVRGAGYDLPRSDESAARARLLELYTQAVRAQTLREEQARIREQAREDQARQRQIEAQAREAEEAERARLAAQEALNRALQDAAGRHEAELVTLRQQLTAAEERLRRATPLAQLTRVGHVYVISNIGSFGQGVFKIGMSRREDPQHRVDELGDASVPFPFDVHMMIRCDDAPALEAALHHTFRSRRVNRVNLRKEFFRITVEEIAAAVRDHHGEVEYVAEPEALQYWESQRTTDAQLQVMERVQDTIDAERSNTTDE
ncbi:Phage protein OS=Escherichia coli STEC_MHI813 GN=ECSTECMHI813_3288 PE=4 SV=1: T5orf172 [Gemmata massiliana]|uniref:Bacteriophage T5 Orf172 DNA-binding domain-containing protein n=1 Tax=Gemmata massiliana TaxID=1210884 RepID=A0A6P2D9P9_9BACT|nr:GIY-YIG nuclease family protein [Gemmata massiliana]VTR97899.1 Phage protein OS=Escherichia coli STEC_MHI813 GN=ECSTECMHI813_3288 PE=4 SV=1: T5orf172 [Gemmata massiliana]